MQRLNEYQDPQNSSLKVLLVDGLRSMTTLAKEKLAQFQRNSLLEIRYEVEDIFGNMHKIQDQGPFQLITCQRVLTTCKLNNRHQQIQNWADLLDKDGQLLIDIPHPSRHPAALRIGRPVRTQIGPTHVLQCIQISNESIFEECRDYARELAQSAGL